MSERPEGTPEEAPAEPEAAQEAPVAEVAEAAVAAGEAEAPAGEVEVEAPAPEAAVAEETEVEEISAEELGDDDLADDELADDTVVPVDDESAAPPVPAMGAAVPRRRGAPAPVGHRAPTQSELAVRVTDNASRFFVIGTVIVFLAILGFGLLGGNGGFLTNTPEPTVAPSVSAGPSPSASAEASPSAPVEPSPATS